MANIDSLLKTKDITSLTKVSIVEAMIFPVVTYGYESWTMKKVEQQRIDVFEWWCWRRLLRVPQSKDIKPVKFGGNQPWILIGRTDAEVKVPILWPPDENSRLIGKDSDAGETEGRERRGQQRMRWLDDITDAIDMNLGKLWEMGRNREAWHAAVHRVMKSQTWLGYWQQQHKSALT